MLASSYIQLLDQICKMGYDHPDINAKIKSMTPKQAKIFYIYQTGDKRYNGGKIQIVDLYYSTFEKYYGDGNFITINKYEHCDSIETYVFQMFNNMWHQISGDCIDGLDDDKILLDKLNETKELQITAKLCLNRIKRENDVVRTEPNDLTRPEFVCKVVDEMINCAWKAQAEEILSYVGGYRCEGIIGRDGKVLYPKPRRI